LHNLPPLKKKKKTGKERKKVAASAAPRLHHRCEKKGKGGEGEKGEAPLLLSFNFPVLRRGEKKKKIKKKRRRDRRQASALSI